MRAIPKGQTFIEAALPDKILPAMPRRASLTIVYRTNGGKLEKIERRRKCS